MYSLADRIKNGWNAFRKREDSGPKKSDEYTSSGRPDRRRLNMGNERTIITSIYERISIDVAAIDIHHSRVDINGKFLQEVNSGLNHVLNVEANIDQTARAFMQDVVLTMFDEGVVALVPVDTKEDPTNESEIFDILTMRVGTITEWAAKEVRVKLYNDDKGYQEELWLPKSMVAIIENPFYAVMNDDSSVVKRLVHKLELIDTIDDKAGSNKLNLILQLPYLVKGKEKEDHINRRLKEIERQLTESKYGIAYTDGTEKIQTVGGGIENNLFEQITYYVDLLYSQLGMTKGVMDGTASSEEMINYFNRTIEPILASIVEELDRKYISKTAHTQGQTLVYYRDPFKLVPTDKLADILDRLTRNEIISSNEARGIIGFRPVEDSRADELRNKNISPSQYFQMNPVYTDPNSAPLNGEAQPEVPMDYTNINGG